MKVVIAGTGYVGLTTGVALGYLGHEVACIDLVSEKIARLKAGAAPIYEPGLEGLLDLAAPNLLFTDTYDDAGIEEAEVIFISVNTPPAADGSPNLKYVRMAAESIGDGAVDTVQQHALEGEGHAVGTEHAPMHDGLLRAGTGDEDESQRQRGSAGPAQHGRRRWPGMRPSWWCCCHVEPP